MQLSKYLKAIPNKNEIENRLSTQNFANHSTRTGAKDLLFIQVQKFGVSCEN